MHADSSQVASILNPVRGVRDAQERAGIKPTNHNRNNIAAVKERSKLNALQKLQEQESAAAAQYSHSSGGTGGVSTMRRTLSGGSSGGTARRTSKDQDAGRDFVHENKIAAVAPLKTPRPPSRDDASTGYVHKRDYGQVPQYLVDRKIEMAAEYEARMAAKHASLVPPGMRMLPEEERLDTLAILERNRQEVERQLQNLPLLIETPGQIRRQDELTRRMQEIEQAHKIFSRSSVLVHL